MTNLRFEAVTTASRKNPVDVITPVERPSEFFGEKGLQPRPHVQVSAR